MAQPEVLLASYFQNDSKLQIYLTDPRFAALEESYQVACDQARQTSQAIRWDNQTPTIKEILLLIYADPHLEPEAKQLAATILSERFRIIVKSDYRRVKLYHRLWSGWADQYFASKANRALVVTLTMYDSAFNPNLFRAASIEEQFSMIVGVLRGMRRIVSHPFDREGVQYFVRVEETKVEIRRVNEGLGRDIFAQDRDVRIIEAVMANNPEINKLTLVGPASGGLELVRREAVRDGEGVVMSDLEREKVVTPQNPVTDAERTLRLAQVLRRGGSCSDEQIAKLWRALDRTRSQITREALVRLVQMNAGSEFDLNRVDFDAFSRLLVSYGVRLQLEEPIHVAAIGLVLSPDDANGVAYYRFITDEQRRLVSMNISLREEGSDNEEMVLRQKEGAPPLTPDEVLSFIPNNSSLIAAGLTHLVVYTSRTNRFLLVKDILGNWIYQPPPTTNGSGGNGGAGDSSGGMPVRGWDLSSKREIWQMSTVGPLGHKIKVSYSLDKSHYRAREGRIGDVLLVREGFENRETIERVKRGGMALVTYRAPRFLTPLEEGQLARELRKELGADINVLSQEAFMALARSYQGISYTYSKPKKEVPENPALYMEKMKEEEERASVEAGADLLARGSGIVLGLPSGVHGLGQGGVLGRESPGVGVQVFTGGYQPVGSSLAGAQPGPFSLVPGLVQGIGIFSVPLPAQGRPVVVVPPLAPAN